jgi:hypothetical protein
MLVVGDQVDEISKIITDFRNASSWHSLIKALESQGMNLARGRRRLNMKICRSSGQSWSRPGWLTIQDIRSLTSLAVNISAAHVTVLL